jgi:dUTPase
LTRGMERDCVIDMKRRGMDIIVQAANHVQEVFGVELSDEIVKNVLCR